MRNQQGPRAMRRRLPKHLSYDYQLKLEEVPTKHDDRMPLKVVMPGIILGLLMAVLGCFELTGGMYDPEGLGYTLDADTRAPLFSHTAVDAAFIIIGLGIVIGSIVSYVRSDTERKQTTMRSKKKILPLLIAATLTIGATAVAATGKISMWTGSSASRADYTSLPTAEQVTKDIGYRPVLIDTFENGYCFKDGNIVKNSFKDDNANVIEKFKSVSFDYQKNGDVVSFEQQKFNSKLTPSGDIIATVNETNLYYVHYINKVVSDDYELTEQDKKDQSSGKVVFSYDDSASQIEVSQVQSVNWNKDGIQYDLLQIDGKLSAGELADMAREVIDNRR